MSSKPKKRRKKESPVVAGMVDPRVAVGLMGKPDDPLHVHLARAAVVRELAPKRHVNRLIMYPMLGLAMSLLRSHLPSAENSGGFGDVGV